eukprot:6174268-Pleurochrysis_carterae.AAC.1
MSTSALVRAQALEAVDARLKQRLKNRGAHEQIDDYSNCDTEQRSLRCLSLVFDPYTFPVKFQPSPVSSLRYLDNNTCPCRRLTRLHAAASQGCISSACGPSSLSQ